MNGLQGARVALLEGRMGAELAELVRRRGGEPVSAAAVREERQPCAAEVAALLDLLAAEAAPVVVLTTGVGVAALFADAREAGREVDLRAVLARATLIARGPKPLAALAREGIAAPATVRSPFTTTELRGALAAIDLAGRCAVLVHYGERSEELVEAVARRGARVRELVLYAWRLPEDLGPLRALVDELAGGRVQAVLFTSQAQARHLFRVAAEMGRADALRAALRGPVAVGAVGPTCARALEDLGVAPDVVPATPKMGQLVAALTDHLARGRSVDPTPGGRGLP